MLGDVLAARRGRCAGGLPPHFVIVQHEPHLLRDEAADPLQDPRQLRRVVQHP